MAARAMNNAAMPSMPPVRDAKDENVVSIFALLATFTPVEFNSATTAIDVDRSVEIISRASATIVIPNARFFTASSNLEATIHSPQPKL